MWTKAGTEGLYNSTGEGSEEGRGGAGRGSRSECRRRGAGGGRWRNGAVCGEEGGVRCARRRAYKLDGIWRLGTARKRAG